MKSLLTTACALLLGLAFALPAYAADGREGGGRKGKKHKKGRHSVAKLFKRFDKDESGSLTSDEVPEKLWSRLAKADGDGDGAVTKDEIKAARKKRGKGRRGKRKGGSSEPPSDD